MPQDPPRKKKKAKAAKKAREEKANELPPPIPLPPVEDTLWTTFTSHPLVKVLPIILIPFLFFRSYYFFRLQHPEYLGLRPSVGMYEERQVLIVGSMSTGLPEVAADLYEHLHLEVSHEASDASWYFVRDGTMSTFLGMRFLPRPVDAELIRLCVNRTVDNLGFHPKLYHTNPDCSQREQWSACWAKTCIQFLNQEWGCGTTASTGNDEIDGATCATPYRKTLLQLRHPLRTVEEVVTRSCNGKTAEGAVHPVFLDFVQTAFPDSVYATDSCLEVAVKYTVQYTRAMLDARAKGFIDGVFKVEEATSCAIAELAGYTTPDTVVYHPNYDKVQNFCADPFSQASVSMSAQKHTINKDQVKLDWSDLKAGVHGIQDEGLGAVLRELTVELGYDPDGPRLYDDREADTKIEF